MAVILRILVSFLKFLAGSFLVVLLAAWVSARPSNGHLFPVINGEPVVEIAVADHGVHAGIVVSREALEDVAAKTADPVLSAITQRFGAYSFLEIGWGDEQFYRFVPTLSAVTLKMAFNALAGFDQTTVLHIVGLQNDAKTTFIHSDVQIIKLSKDGFRKLGLQLANSFAVNEVGDPIELGQGIYGPSLFYQAVGHYSLLYTCNRWLSDLLNAAGLASSPLPATLSTGLLAELRYRNPL